MVRRPFLAAPLVVLASLAAASPAAHAISIDCAARPADPFGYPLPEIRADHLAQPTSAPAIAVVDSGVASVPELQGRLRAGYDVAGGDANTNDIDGHGTAVASLAAAAAGGVEGVSPASPIIPIKLFDDTGNSTPDDFVAAIERAIALGAKVINISASVPRSDVGSATAAEVKNAIDSAVSLGIPVIAATGNDGVSTVGAPASYPHVIAVGGTDRGGAPAGFSNTGSELDLVAPAVDIITAAPAVLCSTGYGSVTGTSFAAPQVAGAAALLLARHPDLEVGQLADMLRLRGVRSPAPAWSEKLGFGMLDVAASLDAPVPSSDLPEVNDTIKWAKLMPPVLTASTRTKTLFARIAPHMDPADVYRMQLKRGDRLQVRLQEPSGTRLKLSFGTAKLSPRRGTSFGERIRKTGTYFVGVAIAKSPPAGSGYALNLKR